MCLKIRRLCVRIPPRTKLSGASDLKKYVYCEQIFTSLLIPFPQEDAFYAELERGLVEYRLHLIHLSMLEDKAFLFDKCRTRTLKRYVIKSELFTCNMHSL